jgi:hypothetical protein
MFQVTETSETYQPLPPSVPLALGVITGAVRSSVLGRQSQMPREVLAWSATPSTRKPPPGGHHPKPTRPSIGSPASLVDAVQPAVHSV